MTAAVADAFGVRGLRTFASACAFVHDLPYGRVTHPFDVLESGRGTCSSKHALLAMLAREWGVDAELTLAWFEMDGINTPAVRDVLDAASLPAILEAHTLLRVDGVLRDFTFPGASSVPHLVYEVEGFCPSRLGEKPALHRARLRRWCEERELLFCRVWDVREAAIAALSAPRAPIEACVPNSKT